MIHTYKVSGMSCGGCAHNVEEMLSEIEGVVSANVDIATGTAAPENHQSRAKSRAADCSSLWASASSSAAT